MAFGEILLVGYSRQSRAGKMAPSCPLGQPITARDLAHLARSRSQPYNKLVYTKRVDSVKGALWLPSSISFAIYLRGTWEKDGVPVYYLTVLVYILKQLFTSLSVASGVWLLTLQKAVRQPYTPYRLGSILLNT